MPNAQVQLRTPTGAQPDDSFVMVAGAWILNPIVRQLQRNVRWHLAHVSARATAASPADESRRRLVRSWRRPAR